MSNRLFFCSVGLESKRLIFCSAGLLSKRLVLCSTGLLSNGLAFEFSFDYISSDTSLIVNNPPSGFLAALNRPPVGWSPVATLYVETAFYRPKGGFVKRSFSSCGLSLNNDGAPVEPLVSNKDLVFSLDSLLSVFVCENKEV